MLSEANAFQSLRRKARAASRIHDLNCAVENVPSRGHIANHQIAMNECVGKRLAYDSLMIIRARHDWRRIVHSACRSLVPKIAVTPDKSLGRLIQGGEISLQLNALHHRRLRIITAKPGCD